ncbi:flavoprotein [Streptomyces sp. NPDC008061]|uniref:flavoprotein n=1 Tax=Streptomyces sp. NPDC008061 TaxID=3364805 RepID=UPI0036EE8980
MAVALTPNAGWWMRANGELDRLETLTGLPVRDALRLPTEPRPHPVADGYVVAPAIANYIAKLATGIAETQALTQVSEALGTTGIPVVMFPPSQRSSCKTSGMAGAHRDTAEGGRRSCLRS